MTRVTHDFSLFHSAIAHIQHQNIIKATAEARSKWLPKLGIAILYSGLGLAAIALAVSSWVSAPSVVAAVPRDVPLPNIPASSEAPTTEKVVTDYVVFHKSDLAGGRVETGWHYSSEMQLKPDHQWCHFIRVDTLGIQTVTPYELMSQQMKVRCRWFVPVPQVPGDAT